MILQKQPTPTLVIKDHGAGEIADYIVVYDFPERKEIHLYFCDRSYAPRPGLRNRDLYNLAGRGNRSVDLANEPRFFTKILDRTLSSRGTMFIIGNFKSLDQLASAGSESQYKYVVYLVQPGLSVSEVNQKGSPILVSCNKWLVSHGLVLKVIGS